MPVDRTCYRYHYVVFDGVGNSTTYSSPDVKVDATAPPVPALGFSALDNAYWSGAGSAIFYRSGAAGGGFRVTATSTDTTAGTNAVDFPVLPAGWTSSSGGLGIQTYAWSAPNPAAPAGAQTVTATNHAGSNSTASFTATADADAPAGGSVSYTTGYTASSTISVAFSAGADTGSGLDAASALLQRSQAPLANGICSTFDAFVTVAAAPSTPNSDSVAAGNCYQYRYRIADHVGNLATYSSAVVAKVDGGAPAVTIADPGAAVHGSITVSVNADDGAGVTTVTLQRAPSGTTTWTDVCTDMIAPYSCVLDTTTLALGAYDLRASATDGAGNSAWSDTATTAVDNVLPTITMTDPGTPINGTITLATTADDVDSGVAGVTIQRSPAGINTWTDTCVIAASPWTCRFITTTLTDGSYDLRAIVIDLAGNTRTSAVVATRTVNNLTAASVSLEDPGAYLSGTVTLQASAAAPVGVVSVRIQRSGAGLNSWTDICTDTTSPYTCAFDTATAATPLGLYDLRSVMTQTGGGTLTSAPVTGRTIDNSAVRAVDVQAANAPGGTLGRMEAATPWC